MGIKGRAVLIWLLLLLAVAVPIFAATLSPQLSWRDPIYITAGFAGIVGMTLLLFQPLLAGRYLPGLTPIQSRQIHRVCGILLVFLVVMHVAGLWITSPPDMIDALLFRSPTPFSKWGVLSMWALVGAAIFAIYKPRLKLKNRTWQKIHFAFAAIGVVACVLHVVQIEGTMEFYSKIALCILVSIATIKVGFVLFKR